MIAKNRRAASKSLVFARKIAVFIAFSKRFRGEFELIRHTSEGSSMPLDGVLRRRGGLHPRDSRP
jgi:hypothetical protein